MNRKGFAIFSLICLAPLGAQEAPLFPRPSYFKKMFSSPTGRVDLQPPARLEDYVVDGKLQLALRNYLDLVMANNTDITVTKLSVEASRYSVQMAFQKFDPTLTFMANTQRQTSPGTTQLGATISKQVYYSPSLTYNQQLVSGATFNVAFSGFKQSNNNPFSTFNPSYNSTFSAGFGQPLLRGRSPYIVRLPITVARATLRSTELGMRSQIMGLVQDAENAYWEVVLARETLRVNEEALKNAIQSLNRSEKQMELGALVPLDIYQPRANKASAEIQVTQQRFGLVQAEDALRKQIGADLDPKFRDMPIVLTELATPPAEIAPLDREALVQRALARRPDLESARVGLDVDDMNIRQASDALRPNLSLTGSYASTGRGGPQLFKSGLGDASVTQVIPGGLGNALSDVFAFQYPTYTLGLRLDLPLRDRYGQANLANYVLRKKADALNLRSLEQNLRLDVLNAISQVESSRESVKLALVARELAQKQLEGERMKYDLGSEPMYFVLDAENRLTSAQLAVVRNTVNYRRNQLNLWVKTGDLLEERRIVVQ